MKQRKLPPHLVVIHCLTHLIFSKQTHWFHDIQQELNCLTWTNRKGFHEYVQGLFFMFKNRAPYPDDLRSLAEENHNHSSMYLLSKGRIRV